MFHSNISYKLLRFRVFKQFRMNNSITFNIFDGQEKDELIVIIKRCHCVPILIKKYRLC